MNRSIYNLLEILKEVHRATDEFPGKKKLQKVVYLIENIGNVDLGYKYEIHFYGPYSSTLDSSIDRLRGEGLLHYEYEGQSHLICAEEEESDGEFFAPDLSEAEMNTIKSVIDKFAAKTPNELELLTTTHFAYVSLPNKPEDSIVSGVKKIKGIKYSEVQIKNAMKAIQ